MALLLTIEDEEDGATATATIAGADAATVTVYTSPDGSTTWTSAGTRSGNGTLTITRTPGYYFAYAAGTVSGSPAVTAPVRFVISRDSESIHDKFLNAVQAAIQALALDSLSDTYPQSIPYDRVHVFPSIEWEQVLILKEYPCVIVSETFAEVYEPIVNARDDIGYPALVSIIDRASPAQKNPDPYPTYRRWREQIARAIRFQHGPSNLTEIYIAKIEPLPPKWREPDLDLYCSSIMFRGMTRDPRGV